MFSFLFILNLQVSNSPSSSGSVSHVIQRGCVPKMLADSFCESDEPGSEVVCCHGDRCNSKLHLQEEAGRGESHHGSRRRLLQLSEGKVQGIESMVIS